MKKNIKLNNTYYLSVEGETEKWYFEWLEDTINANPDIKKTITIIPKKEKSPKSASKKFTLLKKTTIYHVFDRESEDEFHVKQFHDTLTEMADIQKTGRSIVYKLAYSNYTFDLWMILHKMACETSLVSRDKYLTHINRAYGKNFKSMAEYKKEDNFKDLLKTLSIDDVKKAIERADSIMQKNIDMGYIENEYKGYKFYRENPSLSVHNLIKDILKSSGLN